MLLFWRNYFEQTTHLFCFSPVWVQECVVTCDISENVLKCMLLLMFSTTVTIWMFSQTLLDKSILNKYQIQNGFSPLWKYEWEVRFDLLENYFEQMSHLMGFHQHEYINV